MRVTILSQVAKEIEKTPKSLKEDIYGTLYKLEQGDKFKMPFCRPLASISKGLYELRYSYKAGEFRVFYYIKINDAIYVICATKKKNQKITQQIINLLRSRIRSLR